MLVALLPAAASALGFEALLLGFSEAWIGNGYVPTPNDPGGTYDFDVTGSESMPIDPHFAAGARVAVLEGVLASDAVLSVTPMLEASWRRYLLYESGRVVPTQIEGGAGSEGNTPGIGSSGVLTLRLPVRLGYELRFGGRHAVLMSVSPTGVFRILAGATYVRE